MDAVINDQVDKREEHVRSVLSTLKTLADATEGGDPRRAVERVGAKLVVTGLRSLNETKQASRPRSAIALAAIAERDIGPAFVDYDTEALRDIGFTDDEITKMMAAKLVLYETTPFEQWHVFEKVACALNDRIVMFDTTQDLSPEELSWAADAMRYIDDRTPWGEEVQAYVASILHEAGFVTAPAILAFASHRLTALTSDYGRMVAIRAARGANDTEATHQRNLVAQVMGHVNERHQALLAELRQL